MPCFITKSPSCSSTQSYNLPRQSPAHCQCLQSVSSTTTSSYLSDGLEDPSGPAPNDRSYSDQFKESPAFDSISYTPIAIAQSPFKERHGAPRQPTTEGKRGQHSGSIRLLPDRLGGVEKALACIDDIDNFSHIIVLSHLHLNTGYNERVTPPRLRHLQGKHGKRKKKGVLATRAPHRPNHIGLSVLKLDSVDRDNLQLNVRSTDLIDGTPILDIKPYIKQYDSFPTALSGWMDEIERMELSGELPKVMHDGGAEEEEALRHRKSYSISGTGRESSVQMTTNTGHELFTDVPKKMGGTDSAPQPVEHLLAALIGCAQATAMFVGRSMAPRLLIDRIEFDIKAHRDARGAVQLPIDETPDIPAMLQYVSGTAKVFFKGDGDSTASVSPEDLCTLGEQTEARCPVANMMMASGCAMDIDWIDGGNVK